VSSLVVTDSITKEVNDCFSFTREADEELLTLMEKKTPYEEMQFKPRSLLKEKSEFAIRQRVRMIKDFNSTWGKA